ncbi:YheC/YheD family protein [Mycoplasmatota bacterium WC44]
MLVGAMHMRAHPSKIARVYSFAAAAKMEGVEFFYFSPGKVNFRKKRIRGLYYSNGEWLEKNFPFPNVVINMFSTNTDKQQDIYIKLNSEVIYSENPIGDKEDIYNILNRSQNFRDYLPATEVAYNVKNVHKFLDKHTRIVLKPSLGSQGIGILIIEKQSDSYKVYENGTEVTVKSLSEPLKKLELNYYIMQQFIISETTRGLPVDFRIHTQKNGEGKYILTTIYPRIANVRNKVTNYSQGGYSVDYKSFLEHEYKDDWLFIYKLMKVFAIQLSEYINEYYFDTLNELGVDVGIDENNNIYLYEINWRPGVPIIFRGELDHAKNIIRYCKYKSKNSY